MTRSSSVSTPAETAACFTDSAARNAIHDLIHPQACYRDGRTYITWQGVEYAPMITCYDHAQKRWEQTVRIADNPLQRVARGDDHGAPSIVTDRAGHIHVFYGSHGTPQKHARSRHPLDISEWEELPDVSASMTYPFPMLRDDGTLDFFGRVKVWPNPWFQIQSSDSGRSWSEPQNIIDFLPMGVYAAFVPGARGDTVHCTFVHQDVKRKPEWQNRRHCFYMKRDIEGVWRNVAGEALETPVTFEQAMAKCLVLRTDEPRHSNAATLGVDAEDRPYLLIIDGTAPSPLADGGGYRREGIGGNYIHRFAHWTGREWNISDITSTDWVFDNSGAIDVSRPGRIDVYLVSDGSDRTANKRGGNIEHWTSTDPPDAWTKVRDIITCEQTGELHYAPRLVSGGTREGLLVFCTHPKEYPTPTTRFTEKVYLWGDEGFIGMMNSMSDLKSEI